MNSGFSLVTASWMVPAVLAALSSFAKPNHRIWSWLFFATSLILIVSAIVHWQAPIQWQGPSWVAIGFIPVALRIDSLTAFFLLLLGAICICCAVYSSNYLEHLGSKISGRIYWAALFAFITGMTGVLLAANAAVFVFGWELMALSSAALVVSEFTEHKAQRAAFIYLVATRISTLFLSAGFLLMYAAFHNWSFSAWNFSQPETWIAAGCIMLGLIVKAGVWPFHIWLPYAHPAAPSPVSALMSGAMVKMAVYAAIRFFVLGQLTCQPLIYALFALACISSFWGVLFAINQRELKRLLAYSTVENVGLIFIGLALAMWARNIGLEQIAQIALLAALLHSFAHALFKSLLFLCAGSVDYSAHSREFALLGGLSKNMPVTGVTFMLGAGAICALPPFNGFASKWCLYQALLRGAYVMPNLADRAICVAAIGLLSTVGALAVASFAKAGGVAFLGKARSAHAKHAHEVPPTMAIPQAILAAACVVSGIGASWLILPLRPLMTLIYPQQALVSPFSLIPLWQVAAVLVPLAALIYLSILRGRPARYKTWECGFGTSPAKGQVTADSFAQPIARIFTPVLRYNLSVEISGKDWRHFPEKITVEPSMVSLLETRIYGPAASWLAQLSQGVAKLQAGSIHLYLMYVCIALVVLVFLGTNFW